MDDRETDSSRSTTFAFPKKLALLAALAVVILMAYTQFRDVLTFEALAEQEAHLRELRHEHP